MVGVKNLDYHHKIACVIFEKVKGTYAPFHHLNTSLAWLLEVRTKHWTGRFNGQSWRPRSSSFGVFFCLSKVVNNPALYNFMPPSFSTRV